MITKLKFRWSIALLVIVAAVWLGLRHVAKWRDPVEQKRQQTKQALLEAYRRLQPVTVYGEVLDLDGQPVEGVEVVIAVQRMEQLFSKPRDELRAGRTDARGLFEIVMDKPWHSALESVSKPGYIFYARDPDRHDYAHQKTDPHRRTRLVVRKIGTPAFLLQVPPGRVGNRVLMARGSETKPGKWSISNLESYHAFWTNTRDIEVSARLVEDGTDWEVTFRAVSPNGGLLLSKKELFMAPEEGYQRGITFRAKAEPVFGGSGEYYLYLKTRSPTICSKLRIEQSVYTSREDISRAYFDLSVKSWTNPYGERNFEPLQRTAENFQAQDAHTEYCLQCINEGRRADPKHLADLLEAGKTKEAP